MKSLFTHVKNITLSPFNLFTMLVINALVTLSLVEVDAINKVMQFNSLPPHEAIKLYAVMMGLSLAISFYAYFIKCYLSDGDTQNVTS
jgi:uncharacterized membrane protein